MSGYKYYDNSDIGDDEELEEPEHIATFEVPPAIMNKIFKGDSLRPDLQICINAELKKRFGNHARITATTPNIEFYLNYGKVHSAFLNKSTNEITIRIHADQNSETGEDEIDQDEAYQVADSIIELLEECSNKIGISNILQNAKPFTNLPVEATNKIGSFITGHTGTIAEQTNKMFGRRRRKKTRKHKSKSQKKRKAHKTRRH